MSEQTIQKCWLRKCHGKVLRTAALFVGTFALQQPLQAQAQAHTHAWTPCEENLAQVVPERRYECAEQELWYALGDGGHRARQRADSVLSRVLLLTAIKRDLTNVQRSQLHFYRGALRLAMALENGRIDLGLFGPLTISPDFKASVSLDPQNDHFVSFLDSMDVAMPALLGNMRAATRSAEKGFANVAQNPMLNTLSLSGTTIGMPLSTGVPEKTLALLEAWRCEGEDFCTRNTDKAPFARPGLAYHFAEAYARMGKEDQARSYFESALSAPGADAWPFAYRVREHLADLPAYMKRFSDLGADGSAMKLVYANQASGCVFCHGRP